MIMKRKTITTVIALIMFVMAVGLMGRNEVFADGGTVKVIEIDYEKETLTIEATAADSMIFFANTKTATSWETVAGEIDSATNRITMDISWASKTKNVVFYIKGDSATEPVQVTLPKQLTSFSGSLNYSTGKISFSGATTNIEWRKSTSTTWNEYKSEIFSSELEGFYMQGGTLYFRVKQTVGSAITTGSRPSKEASIKIIKRATGPSVNINYSALTITAKSTMEYKVGDSKWEPVSGTYLSLKEACENILYENHKKTDDEAEKIEVSIDVRTKATSSKPASKAVTLTINGQKHIDDDNIFLKYTGSTQLTLSVETIRNKGTGAILYEGASPSNQYEYTIVDKDKDLNIATASWSSITSSNGITISSTKAPTGSKVYIRKKATNNALAGHYVEIPVGIYPSEAMLEKDVVIKKVKGVEQNETFVVLFDSITENAENIMITSIKFEDESRNNIGNVGFKQGSVETLTMDNGKTYKAITVTITDYSDIEGNSKLLDKQLYSRITISGSSEIVGGVLLYVYPAASIKHLDEDGNIDNSNITMFCEVDDMPTSVTGGIYKISLGSETKKDVKVTSVTLGGYSFVNNTDYTVSSKTEDNEYLLMITIHGTALVKYKNLLATSKIGKPYQLTIKLSNGEVLTSSESIFVKNIISITSSNTSVVMSQSTYDAYILDLSDYINNIKILGSNSSASGLTEPVAPYTNPTFSFSFDDAFSDYEYGKASLIGATWNNINILVSGNTNTVVLDIKKIITKKGSFKVVLTFSTDKGNITIPTSFMISVVD